MLKNDPIYGLPKMSFFKMDMESVGEAPSFQYISDVKIVYKTLSEY